MRRGGPSVRLHRRTSTTVHPVCPNVMTWQRRAWRRGVGGSCQGHDMQILALVIGLVIGIAVGAVVAWSLARSRAGVDAASARATAEALRGQLDAARHDAEER